MTKLEFIEDDDTLAEANRSYEEYRDLIEYVENVWRPGTGNEATVSKYDYTNDDLGRRTNVEYSGVAFGSPIGQSFDYNDRNELTGSTRSTTTWGYEYDNIGNRGTSSKTGDPTMTYIANALNQYQRTETADPKTGQGYRHDEDGNLIELYVAADMALPVGRGDQAIGRASHYPS